VNKDFFSKPISLKDINLKNIDWKNIKNKKEIIISILILIYIIVIICIGSSLLEDRKEVKAELATTENRYNLLQHADSEDKIKADIE